MVILFNKSINMYKYWDNFLDNIWSCSSLIKIVYSISVGKLMIELDKSANNIDNLEKFQLISLLNNEPNEEVLLYAVKKIFQYPNKNNDSNYNKIYYLYNKLPSGRDSNYLNKKDDDIVNKNIKELKIILQDEITTYLHYHLNLCIILTEPDLNEWFNLHFIKICFRIDNKGIMHEKQSALIDYMENKLLFSEIAHITYFSYEILSQICTDIVTFTIKKIMENKYVIIYLDEFCIPNKTFYQVNHFIHQSLIYGYNIEEKYFLAIGFDKNNLLCKMRYGFNEFSQAYKNANDFHQFSATWSKITAVQIFELKENIYPEFILEVFIKNLKDYLLSKASIDEVFNYYEGEDVTYGIDIYNKLKEYLMRLGKGENKIDYRAVHLLYEQKTSIYKRLIYIKDKYEFDDDFSMIIDEFSNIVKSFNSIRLNILKRSMNECEHIHEMYKLYIENDYINHLIDLIDNFALKEKIVIEKIIKYLDGYLNKKSSK
jgi:hypothetical protein